jgi:hypothetical protein
VPAIQNVRFIVVLLLRGSRKNACLPEIENRVHCEITGAAGRGVRHSDSGRGARPEVY